MLQGFLLQNFDELVTRAKAKASARRSHPGSAPDLERELSLLLAQLGEALRRETSTAPLADGGTGSIATRHARDLLEKGWAVSQIVHDYGDLRQAITELAIARGTAINLEELRALGRCLDSASAEAVAEYARLKDAAASHRETERLGQVGHDLRNQLQTAQLSFRALKTGKADVGGSAGDALGRSLDRLRDLIDTRLSGVRLAATTRVSLAAFVHEVAVAAHPDAEHREIRLTIEPGDPALAVDVDPQLLASALMNLLQNAFKYTRARGRVTLRARSENGRAFVEVEDECGGMATSDGDPLRGRRERRGTDRAAPGFGLSSSRRAVQANGGEVHVHNLPGKGCIFSIQLPVAALLETIDGNRGASIAPTAIA
jgi:signal transduction histidine kinase